MEGESSAEWPHFPFCSDRCKLIDLGRWLGESYRIVPANVEEGPVDVDDERSSP
jgi:endogenous inhibitor of DNA gyrase (YacG/DUF329 family)